MDATRTRRTRDRARQGWYACYRQYRFARYLGFPVGPEGPIVGATTAWRPSSKGRPAIGRSPGLAAIGPGSASPADSPYVGSLMAAVG